MKLLKTKQLSTSQQTELQTQLNHLINNIDEAVVENEFANLIEQIRKGNESRIPELVNNSKLIVLKVIKQSSLTEFSLEEMLVCANEALTKLAQSELSNSGKEVYLRFCDFTVRQSLLNLKS